MSKVKISKYGTMQVSLNGAYDIEELREIVQNMESLSRALYDQVQEFNNRQENQSAHDDQ